MFYREQCDVMLAKPYFLSLNEQSRWDAHGFAFLGCGIGASGWGQGLCGRCRWVGWWCGWRSWQRCQPIVFVGNWSNIQLKWILIHFNGSASFTRKKHCSWCKQSFKKNIKKMFWFLQLALCNYICMSSLAWFVVNNALMCSNTTSFDIAFFTTKTVAEIIGCGLQQI